MDNWQGFYHIIWDLGPLANHNSDECDKKKIWNKSIKFSSDPYPM